jgi:hypothetical protein
MHVTEQIPSRLINDDKMKDPAKVADAFNSFFPSIAEILNLHQVGKRRFNLFFKKNAFSYKFHGIEIVPTSEAEIKKYNTLPQIKNSSGYDEITSKILKACASLIS